MKVSVVIPCYRSPESLPEQVARVRAVIAADGHEAEVILVVDGSPDDTAERARWSAQGIAFGRRPDLYGMADRAAAIIGACARGEDVPA